MNIGWLQYLITAYIEYGTALTKTTEWCQCPNKLAANAWLKWQIQTCCMLVFRTQSANFKAAVRTYRIAISMF